MRGEMGEVPPQTDVATAAAEAESRGVTLMVRSLYSHYSIPYPAYAQEIREGKAFDTELTPAQQYAAAAATHGVAEMQDA